MVKITIEAGDKKVVIEPRELIQEALVELNKKVDVPFLNEEQEQAIFDKLADTGLDIITSVIIKKLGD